MNQPETSVSVHNGQKATFSIHPKLIGFLIISIFLGATLTSTIPGNIALPDIAKTLVLTIAIWFFCGLFTHFLCRVLGGKGDLLETVSICLQLFAVIFVISSLISVVWFSISHNLLFYAFIHGNNEIIDLLINQPELTSFAIQLVFILFYFPIALGYIHRFGLGRQLLIAATIPLVLTAITSLVLLGFSSQQNASSCSTVKIISPVGAPTKSDSASFTVPANISITWEPNSCVMVVQYYQNGTLVGEYRNVVSGETINIGDPNSGATEIAIWQEGAAMPASNIWVWVK